MSSKKWQLIPRNTLRFSYRKRPETFFLEFLDRHQGRKCLYVPGENDGKMLVRLDGLLKITTLKIDPDSELAMTESLGPITAMGFGPMIAAIEAWYEKSLKDSDARMYVTEKIRTGQAPLVVVDTRPPDRPLAPDADFLRMVIDTDLSLPVQVAFRRGNTTAQYVYRDITVNPELTDADFTL